MQDAWLGLLAHPEAVRELRWKRLRWTLQGIYEFYGTPKRWQWHHAEYVGDRGGGSDGGRVSASPATSHAVALRHAQAAREFRTLRLDTVDSQEREFLYQNLWAIGTPVTVEALVGRLGGERLRDRGGTEGIWPNLLKRAYGQILRAFPTREALLGPSRAVWLHPSCRAALAAYSGRQARGPCGKVRRYKLYCAKPSEDARAFYDRQLALGWGLEETR